MSTESARKVIWIDPDGGDRKRGTIPDFDPDNEIHYVHLDDGGYAEVFERELEFPGAVKVIWLEPQTSSRKRGTIPAYDATEDIHLVQLEDGGEIYAPSHELELPSALSTIDMGRILAALDGGTNMLATELKADNRARIFKAIETCTHEDWAAARGSYVHGRETLWQAVIRVHGTCLNGGDTPGRQEIIEALEAKPVAAE